MGYPPIQEHLPLPFQHTADGSAYQVRLTEHLRKRLQGRPSCPLYFSFSSLGCLPGNSQQLRLTTQVPHNRFHPYMRWHNSLFLGLPVVNHYSAASDPYPHWHTSSPPAPSGSPRSAYSCRTRRTRWRRG